ncbi:hypothetical protein [Brochothrix thermosphacta]|uniref:hypothetical protein n=1 Tax=Brochothrix thermosphacta TaxID=2756 RepID=UPI00083F58B5|nr:hypothetical protein [Brochothrix thermosphacta]MDO7862912.1 hypothetical protein [Brochothrix thermosphacta]ODJ62353.1 hypothetical protein BFR35_11300 [Brochothrix thermosphacta]ODJ65316.1 hypothetical protein BFR37_10595 [Brochothrix thermosphacta]SPN71736.1 putative lantibiotic lichenicidin [Brochothrix thermosphacta]
MTNEEKIYLWRNPECRSEKRISHPSGEMIMDTMTSEIQVQPETTPTITISSVICGDIITSGIIVVSRKWC